EPDHDFADASQALGVERHADRQGRGLAAERHALGGGTCGATDIRGRDAILADAEKRAIPALIVVAQRLVLPIAVAAEVAQRLERIGARTAARRLAGARERAVVAKGLARGVGGAAPVSCGNLAALHLPSSVWASSTRPLSGIFHSSQSSLRTNLLNLLS